MKNGAVVRVRGGDRGEVLKSYYSEMGETLDVITKSGILWGVAADKVRLVKDGEEEPVVKPRKFQSRASIIPVEEGGFVQWIKRNPKAADSFDRVLSMDGSQVTVEWLVSQGKVQDEPTVTVHPKFKLRGVAEWVVQEQM